ncbi:MAG: hypothetical protein LBH18_06865 [Spirochaetaceae bacterium]|nr:hypothetical protein [Spirochaetaceae bacterium]
MCRAAEYSRRGRRREAELHVGRIAALFRGVEGADGDAVFEGFTLECESGHGFPEYVVDVRITGKKP